MRVARPGPRAASGLAGAALLLLIGSPIAAAPPSAQARELTTGLYASEYESPHDATRNQWFDTTVQAGAGIVRANVVWRQIAGSSRPADPADPGDPGYDFAALDRLVRGARERGLDVMFTVYKAPDWAESPGRPASVTPGTWEPDPDQFAAFGTALATRYSGRYPDPGGPGALPAVRYFEVWNEPNLREYLAPQWDGDRPVAPEIYRRLLNSFYSAVKAVRTENLVIGPAAAPYGDPPGGGRMRPLKFLRELLCLSGRHKLKPRPCPERAQLDIVSDHPISVLGGPEKHAANPDDTAGGDLDKVRRIVHGAEKRDTLLPSGKRPLWVTEFWWLTDHPRPQFEVSPGRQARWIEQELHEFWSDGARVAIYYLIRDAPNFGAGLFFADGREKPAFQAFSFPFVTDRRSRQKVVAWGKSPAEGRLTIQVRKGGAWKTVKRLRVGDGSVFKARIRARGKARLRASVGGETSLVWKQPG